MFFEAITRQHGLIEIKMGHLENDKEFEDFMYFWEQLHTRSKSYKLLFDARNLPNLGISYAYKMAKFLGKIKHIKPNPLKYSIICINSSIIRNLLYFIFKLQKPMSTVYLTDNYEDSEQIEIDLLDEKEPKNCTKI